MDIAVVKTGYTVASSDRILIVRTGTGHTVAPSVIIVRIRSSARRTATTILQTVEPVAVGVGTVVGILYREKICTHGIL